jgi:hypothetical protein
MPHTLDGIWEKIRRAEELTQYLDGQIKAFTDSDAFKTVGVSSSRRPEHRIFAVGPSPPLRFAVISGEVIHHCRSVLDYVVRCLVLANHGKPDRQAFPICDHSRAFQDAKSILTGVSPEAIAYIESIQPYHTNGGFEWSIFWVLHRMNLIDKHRLLVVLTTQASLYGIGIDSKECADEIGIVGLVSPKKPIQPTPDGTEIFRLRLKNPAPQLNTITKPEVQAVFELWNPLPGVPVIEFLNRARTRVVHVVKELNRFMPRGRTVSSSD